MMNSLGGYGGSHATNLSITTVTLNVTRLFLSKKSPKNVLSMMTILLQSRLLYARRSRRSCTSVFRHYLHYNRRSCACASSMVCVVQRLLSILIRAEGLSVLCFPAP